MMRSHQRLDISPHVEVPFNSHAQRITGLYKVLEDHIDDVLVKYFHFAERIDVHLQTLELDAAFVRNVNQPQRRKIRKV